MEAVDHPAHYQTAAGIEAIEVMERYGLGPHLFDAMAYLLRAGRKGNYVEDLRKADWYIKRAVEHGDVLYFDLPRWQAWRSEWTHQKVCEAFGISGNHAYAVRYILTTHTFSSSWHAQRRLVGARQYIADAIAVAEAQS